MTKLRSKTFDCVQGMRQIPDRLSEEMGSGATRNWSAGCARMSTRIRFSNGWRKELPNTALQAAPESRPRLNRSEAVFRTATSAPTE
jgi:hypothetical protein